MYLQHVTISTIFISHAARCIGRYKYIIYIHTYTYIKRIYFHDEGQRTTYHAFYINDLFIDTDTFLFALLLFY